MLYRAQKRSNPSATQFRLRKAEDRAHILEGYKIALDNLDDFVKIIRASSNRTEAKEDLSAEFFE